MAERHIWIFATPAGHKGTHPGNSSSVSIPFQVFSASFHHWGIFVADEPGDPSKPKSEESSLLGRFHRGRSGSNEGDHAVQGTFFELTRPRDRDIGTLTRTRDVREREEQSNATWITFADTGCKTVRTDSEITNIGQHICRERMSSDYALVGKNCQDWVNLLGNAISVGPWIQYRTLEDIVNRLSWSKSKDRGHINSPAQSSSALQNQQNQPSRTDTWSMSRADYQAQTLSRAQVPNYASEVSLGVPPNNPTIEMVENDKFHITIYSYNGEHRLAVKEVDKSLSYPFSKTSKGSPVQFQKRSFKDSCLVRLGGKDAELAVNVDFSPMKDGRRPKSLEDVLWYLVDYYKLIRTEPVAYDISYGWVAEQRGRVGDTWYLLLRFRTETMPRRDDEPRLPADEHWRFAPQSSKPTLHAQAFDYWAAFNDLTENMNNINARHGRE